MESGEPQFWAKKRTAHDGAEVRYPLLYHMVDTAMVARAMWDLCLHAGAKRFCTRQLGVDELRARDAVSRWAGLHDIGKASPGFQCRDEVTKQELAKRGFDITGTIEHGTVTAAILKGFLRNNVSPELARKVSVAVGGHHGVFPRSKEVNSAQLGLRLWPNSQKALYDTFTGLCGNAPPSPIASDPVPAFFMFLAGLTSVADWIASNETFFSIERPLDASIEAHMAYAQEQAEKALGALFWKGWHPSSAVATFHELFPMIAEERPLQTETESMAHLVADRPGLAIIEAPMGEGKTEAAMYLADAWAAGLGQKGCYFALPTMTTSDQMFGRVKEFLENRYHDQRVGLMLLHGHAALSAEFERVKEKADGFTVANVADEKDESYDHAPSGVVASEWFTFRKRGLLAPFGVGTIDQALLAVLQTKHVFVRLFGIAGKTVIIDEVHAYDTYMATLLERLLEWLAALGSSVVMLSATLPKRRRIDLLKAYAKGLGRNVPGMTSKVAEAPYPRISWTSGTTFETKHVETSPQSKKTLHLEWVNGDMPTDGASFELGKRLTDTLSGGGCTAVICNTVDRAQEVYLALKPYFSGLADDEQPVLDLLHARYLFGERKKREERCLLRFGRKGGKVQCEDGEHEVRRPNRAVLVATQVIEQSLDLDFDLMVTDMTPIDLLLQRAGRMHRHTRPAEERHGLVEPTLWVRRPRMVGDVPDFGKGTEAVYDYHVLLRSWLAVRGKKAIEIPRDVEDLIEAVYDERGSCPQNLSRALKERWQKSQKDLEEKRSKYENAARQVRILPPDMNSESMLESFNKQLEEDDPTQPQSLQALTRTSEQPSASVICLFGSKDRPSLDIGADIVELDFKPDLTKTKQILLRSVSVSNRRLVKALVERREEFMVPAAWREVPLLRHHFLLFFDQNLVCPEFGVRLDDDVGVVLEMKNRA